MLASLRQRLHDPVLWTNTSRSPASIVSRPSRTT
jgi:hypothetical protein